VAPRDQEGFLVSPSDWTPEIADVIAEDLGACAVNATLGHHRFATPVLCAIRAFAAEQSFDDIIKA
jgi:sulfur relay (sulfurtransferase) DsrC/TusE family protein